MRELAVQLTRKSLGASENTPGELQGLMLLETPKHACLHHGYWLRSSTAGDNILSCSLHDQALFDSGEGRPAGVKETCKPHTSVGGGVKFSSSSSMLT